MITAKLAERAPAATFMELALAAKLVELADAAMFTDMISSMIILRIYLENASARRIHRSVVAVKRSLRLVGSV